MRIADRFILVVAFLAARAAGAADLHLSQNDIDAVRRVDAAYVKAWLANDASAVLGLFTKDAVIVPQGRTPIAGLANMTTFWWPAGGKTTVTSFTNTIDETGGSGDLAFTRGSYRFTFDYESEGRVQQLANRGNYLMLYRRDKGRWKISHRMWADLPRK